MYMDMMNIAYVRDSVLYMYSIYNKQKQGRCMFINNFEKWIKLTFFIKKKIKNFNA